MTERNDEAAGFGMTDLEEQLTSADGERTRFALLERFARLDEGAQVEIDAGVSPERFRELTAVRAALAAARGVVLLFNPNKAVSN
jgi:hypothetical protein